MQPIGPLMHEHRLIERMVEQLRRERERLEGGGEADPRFVERAVDFFRTYADALHHGKEEDALFRELGKKEISAEQRRMLDEFMEEHRQAREIVTSLSEAGADPARRGEVPEILGRLEEFYPRHIAKEDKEFFHPIMEYFDREEMDAMLEEFRDVESEVLNGRYKRMVEDLETSEQQMPEEVHG